MPPNQAKIILLLLVGIDNREPEDIGMSIGTADTVLKIITKGENRNNHKYTFNVNRRNISEKEITAKNSCRHISKKVCLHDYLSSCNYDYKLLCKSADITSYFLLEKGEKYMKIR